MARIRRRKPTAAEIAQVMRDVFPEWGYSVRNSKVMKHAPVTVDLAPGNKVLIVDMEGTKFTVIIAKQDVDLTC